MARMEMDWNLKKLGQVLMSWLQSEITQKNTMVFAVLKFVSYLQNSTGAFCVLVKAPSADLSTELAKNSSILVT